MVQRLILSFYLDRMYKKMKCIPAIVMMIGLSAIVEAQEFVNYDYVYHPDIKSVSFGRLSGSGRTISDPIFCDKENVNNLFWQDFGGQPLDDSLIARRQLQPGASNISSDPTSGCGTWKAFYYLPPLLGERIYLQLHFDDLSGQDRYLRYRIEHCDMDWTTSDLEELEYLEGYNDEAIRSVQYSINTLEEYAHYRLTIPNEDVRLTKSGNYLIHVYDEDTEELLLTRRFMVAEKDMPRNMKIEGRVRRPSDVSKTYTHHELQIRFITGNLGMDNPRRDLRAVVMQNQNPWSALIDLEPTIIIDNQIDFHLPDKLVFPAGREFRVLDLRSTRYPLTGILEVARESHGYEIIKKKDQKRTFDNYTFELDQNGSFVITSVSDLGEYETHGDYANVLMTLESSQPIHDHDVYIIGGFCDWQLMPENKMVYQDQHSAYLGELFLKQGVYDYLYVAVPRGGGIPDFEILEGNWHETENAYMVLIYYRPFGERYDRLLKAEVLPK